MSWRESPGGADLRGTCPARGRTIARSCFQASSVLLLTILYSGGFLDID